MRILFLAAIMLFCGISYADPEWQTHKEGWLQKQIQLFKSYRHLDKAYRFIDSGRLTDAKKELERFMAITPNDVEARMTYVVICYQLKDYQDVIEHADILIKMVDRPTKALIYRGLAYQLLNKPNDAIADFQTVAKLPETDADDRRFALSTIADLAITQENYAVALTALDRLAEDNVKDFNLYYRQGVTFERQNHLKKAEEAYLSAYLKSKEADKRLMVLLALGELAKKRGDWTGVIQYFIFALKLDLLNTDLIETIAEAFYNNKNYPEAAQWMKKAHAIRPDLNNHKFIAHSLYLAQRYQASINEYTNLLTELDNDSDRYHVHMALGYAYVKTEAFTHAIEAFSAAAALQESPDVLKAQFEVFSKLENWHGALRVNRTYLEKSDISPQQRIEGLERRALVLIELRQYHEAAVAFQQAIALLNIPSQPSDHNKLYKLYIYLGYAQTHVGNHFQAADAFSAAEIINSTPEALLAKAESNIALDRWNEALRSYNDLLNKKELSISQHNAILESLGHIYNQLGEPQKAVESFQQAITFGGDSLRIRHSLGITYFMMQKWNLAIDQLAYAFNQYGSTDALHYLGYCYKQIGMPGMAAHYFQQALLEDTALTRREQKNLYDELGYLYANMVEYEHAAEAWTQSLRIANDPKITLYLGKMQRLLGKYELALSTINNVDTTNLPLPWMVNLFDESAHIYAGIGRHQDAINALIAANELEPSSAYLQFRLGSYYQMRERNQEAIPYLKSALKLEPDNSRYAISLAYAYKNTGQFSSATHHFENVIEKEPDYQTLYEELGYAHMRLASNKEAAHWFKKAIDSHLLVIDSPSQSQEAQRDTPQTLQQLREDMGRMTNVYDLSIYQNYRTNNSRDKNASETLGIGTTPSDGGIELSYRPPHIGFMSERTFEVFGRTMWSTNSNSLKIDNDSLQAGIGVRYKPIRTHNLYLSMERMIAIGDKTNNNWLLRGLYSWTKRYESHSTEQRWHYSSLYGDLGYFLDRPSTTALHWEAKQGLSFKQKSNLTWSPYLLLEGRHNNPDHQEASRVNAGAGISMKCMFRETRYSAYQNSVEIKVQYKIGLNDSSAGWELAGVLRL